MYFMLHIAHVNTHTHTYPLLSLLLLDWAWRITCSAHHMMRKTEPLPTMIDWDHPCATKKRLQCVGMGSWDSARDTCAYARAMMPAKEVKRDRAAKRQSYWQTKRTTARKWGRDFLCTPITTTHTTIHQNIRRCCLIRSERWQRGKSNDTINVYMCIHIICIRTTKQRGGTEGHNQVQEMTTSFIYTTSVHTWFWKS